MDTASERDVALQLMMVLKDEGVLKQRLQEYTKTKLDAEAAEEKLRLATDEHRKIKDEMDGYINSKKTELETAQRNHDRAAREAAARVALATSHMAEALRVRDENKVKESDLSDREQATREAAAQIEKTKDETQSLHTQARALRDSLQRKHQVLSKALQEIAS